MLNFRQNQTYKVVVVAPVYDDAPAATELLRHLNEAFSGSDVELQVMLVDDGSPVPLKGSLANGHTGCAGNGARYAWWLTADNPPCSVYPMTLINDYAQEPNGSLASNAVWPDIDAGFGCPASYSNGLATWPQIPSLSGGIHNGLPPGGDFVPSGVAGINYLSPGYM